MAEGEEELVSKYSSGVSILIRIDGLWKDANTHSRAGLFSKWNTDLDVIWRELARDLKDEIYKEKKEEFDAFDSALISVGRFKDSGSETFDSLAETEITKRDKHYKILNNKELFLKRLENSIGKGTTWGDKDEEDF